MCVCAKSLQSYLTICDFIAHQTPLSMGFSRQEYWSRLLCSLPGDLLDPGIKSLNVSCIGRWVLYSNTTWEAPEAKHDYWI